jgi:predicted ATPase
LLLDNVEHVFHAAPIVTELLAACPRLSDMATSREALRLSGERVVAVPPLARASLPLPAGKSDRETGATLFVSRRTVATPVAAIFRKPGASSRAAAVARAVRRGLA